MMVRYGLIAATLLAAAWPPAAAACRHVTVIDSASGLAVTGIEDIAVDFAAGVAFLSAHDRRAAASAVADNLPALPSGHIYRLALAQIDATAETLVLEPAEGATGGAGGFLPHGIGLYSSPAGDGLYAVNRSYARRDGRWVADVRIEQFARTGDGLTHRRSIADPRLCRANDVAGIDDRRFLFTSDGGACAGLAAAAEAVFNWAGATVSLYVDGAIRTVAKDIRFANGIALSRDGKELNVAATRDRAVLVYRLDRLLAPDVDPVATPDRRIGTGGGPDNLTLDSRGRLVVAVLPDLFRYALFRSGLPGFPRSASRVIGLAPDGDRASEVLFDDPDGRILSGATVAIRGGGWLVAGSALAPGLALCGGARSGA